MSPSTMVTTYLSLGVVRQAEVWTDGHFVYISDDDASTIMLERTRLPELITALAELDLDRLAGPLEQTGFA